MKMVDRLAGSQTFRFLVTGTANTIATYGMYVVLKMVFHYQVAYFISYLCGIVFAYLMSALFVFKRPISLRAFIRFPVVYVVQYLAGALLLSLFVKVLGLSFTLAPLLVIFATLPISFLLSRFILQKY